MGMWRKGQFEWCFWKLNQQSLVIGWIWEVRLKEEAGMATFLVCVVDGGANGWKREREEGGCGDEELLLTIQGELQCGKQSIWIWSSVITLNWRIDLGVISTEMNEVEPFIHSISVWMPTVRWALLQALGIQQGKTIEISALRPCAF